ncbi:MAG: OmpA family protein [Pseudomonadota bacterium]
MTKVSRAAACSLLLWPLLVNAKGVDEAPVGEAVEKHISPDEPFMQWVQDPERVATDMADVIVTRETTAEAYETIKLSGLVPPVRFESGVVDIPSDTVVSLSEILGRMQEKHNVRLHLVGHADSQPLSPALQAIYEDNEGLSRERAGEVAEFLQDALALPAEGVSYEWMGDRQPVATNLTPAGRAENRRVEIEVWYDAPGERVALEEFLVPHEIKRVKACRIETVCKLRYVDGHARRARVQNLIAPLYYDEQSIEVTDEFISYVEEALDNLAEKQNVAVRFVGYSDDRPLEGRMERIYGDSLGLSKARARRVALAVQDGLDLRTEVVDSDGRGSDRPLGSNQTAHGRALNRRVEVEFWYDDPLKDLPDEPRMCPEEGGAEVVTRVFDPPAGPIEDVQFVDGEAAIPPGYATALESALAAAAGKTNLRLRFLGYTRNESLERRTAAVYGDDIGLSASRARRVMEQVAEELVLEPSEAEFEGRGYVHSSDVVNTGFIQGDTSHVAVQVVYDELAILDDYEGVDITRITRELKPEDPLGLNLMRITVDGVPIDDPERSSADIQRCTDVAMEVANIQFGFDNLRSAPRLSVTTRSPRILVDREVDVQAFVDPVEFRMYTNYSYFIEHAEVRVFEAGQSLESEPLDVVAMPLDGVAQWAPPAAWFKTPMRELNYVLRAYGEDGNFDETTAQPIWIVYEDIPSPGPIDAPLLDDFAEEMYAAGDGGDLPGDAYGPAFDGGLLRVSDEDGAEGAVTHPLWTVYEDTESAAPQVEDTSARPRRLGYLSGYGENRLGTQNITLGSGTVSVRGDGVPADHEVYVAGKPVPVSASGSFVTEEVLPDGAHTVEVAVIDPDGRGDLYLRDLEFESNDWFYVGMADLTVSEGSAGREAELLAGDNPAYDVNSNVDGRLAFFVNGKFGKHWRLTASADTREGPIEDIFSNFMAKDPQSLFRRIDPDYYYPTFGDDSTVEELAPTMGKFYVRLSDGTSHGQWGNFKIGYMNNELAQVDRGMYGANLGIKSKATTGFGDQRYAVEVFGAEPGTVPGRDEFRGTGGSLYFLNRQDILVGSERVRIETRDKASGIVTGVTNLTPMMDYDVDYLQGRIVLAAPLNSTANDNLLVRNDAVSGDEAYLVVRYEYTPGFDDLSTISTGGQAHYWLGDYVKLGITASTNEQDEGDSSLNGADLTLRLSAETWLKHQTATSEGLVSLPTFSADGGFDFAAYDANAFVNAEADADRTDLSIGMRDLVGWGGVRLTAYTQEIGAGYSAPGLTALTDTTNYGGSLSLPMGDRLALTAKLDYREQELGIETEAVEYNLSYQVSYHWDVSAGYREDSRSDGSINVPLSQELGERADAVLQVGYDSKDSWRVYGFTQDTLSTTGDRETNARSGIGGSFRFSELLSVDAEVSDGDLGSGGRVGTNYIVSDRTSMYLNYALENERTDTALAASRGREGNLVAGIKSRLGDSTSVFLEERHQRGSAMTGLTHATGVTFAPSAKWSMGINTDIGTLRDQVTGAETERVAGGIQFGYGTDALQFASAVEYRSDDAERPDLTRTERKTWLFRNNFKYQLNPGSRLLGQFNHATSESSEGEVFDGGFTEAVLGYAMRPVDNDRLNALVKYTYFFNVPTTGQTTLQNVAAEFLQKSHIAAVDVTYDLTPRFSIGGKYAYRLAQVSLDREDPEFFDNNASLYVVRGDYRLGKHWEVLAEARLLDMPDLDESRGGALLTISRYLGDHVKIGVGYNFTDFSEDLTDLSYDHHGVFLNLTGSM